ncbi:hypothetical protein PGT21_030240 [Puccinia graminis f. sp. tritici]|uniref:Uncharacterized protein n=1 Tax=Puccinia graminis f. sp. tritici TaxID=56615 RepID=A0A5B0PMJ1_PUCGR|nr:hypothetical protein PGT21_030240 [Puccinia graminis f. sp. tritici]
MPRFRFDLTLKLSHGDNKHCVSVARDIFVRLVQCGEYDGLKPEEKDPDAILLLLTNYAKERYFRKNNEKMWPPEKQMERAKSQLRMARRRNLIKAREETALEIGGLAKFRPMIAKCTSDDETDNEVPVASTSKPVHPNQSLKFCKVRRQKTLRKQAPASKATSEPSRQHT